MKSFSAFPLATAFLATLTSSTPTITPPTQNKSSASLAKLCTTYTIPLTITSSNLIFSLPKFKDDFDVTDFITDLTSRTANETFHPFSPPKNETATYTLSGTFCTPTFANRNSKTVLLASHGLGFDRNYWDPSIEPERYSFVDYAVREGYSVFFYDRLGVGRSEKILGYKNQLSIQTALAIELTKAVKEGNYTGKIGRPEKLVLVGHSYGSAISAAVLTAEPGLADGVVLTGFSYAGSSFNPFLQVSQLKIASLQDKKKWGDLDSGYLTNIDITSNVNAFFKKLTYTLPIANYAYNTKQPIAISELLSATAVSVTPFNFTGSALLIAGQFDFIFCASACGGILEHPSKEIFANAKAFKAVSYPGAAHALNLASTAPGAFKIIFEFIAENV